MSEWDGIDRTTAEPLLLKETGPLTEEMLLECLALYNRRMEWLRRNPPGSKNNPYILHPQTVKALKELGWHPEE